MIMGRAVLDDVARDHRLSVQEIRGRGRSDYLSCARRAAARRMREELGYSYPQIGELLARDHTTIHFLLNGKRRDR
jgi:chromosomal replication initiation ATPase DnaA